MALKIISADELQKEVLDPVDEKTLNEAKEILDDIKKNNLPAFLKHAERLGDLKPSSKYLYSPEDLKQAFESLSTSQQSVLTRTAARIRSFATAQLNSISSFSVPVPGGMAGQTLSPVSAAGCYAPGGRYPLPSSVLMTAITARVAGVAKVIVASPHPTTVTLAAAHLAQADILISVGGPQAIAAFAYGLKNDKSNEIIVPKCQCIVGPGNRWVTAAKKIVSGSECCIDMLAGPSECLVIADSSANAKIIASDLLAQAEHDTDALPILITTDQSLISLVNDQIKKQLITLSTKKIAEVSVNKGLAILCKTLEECISVSDIISPEHLEIMVDKKYEKYVVEKVSNYGGLFIGNKSAEVFGDYGVGPNHVLPTSASAKYTGGLSVFNFLRIRTFIEITERNDELINDAAELARMEGLEGHARAAEMRREL